MFMFKVYEKIVKAVYQVLIGLVFLLFPLSLCFAETKIYTLDVRIIEISLYDIEKERWVTVPVEENCDLSNDDWMQLGNRQTSIPCGKYSVVRVAIANRNNFAGIWGGYEVGGGEEGGESGYRIYKFDTENTGMGEGYEYLQLTEQGMVTGVDFWDDAVENMPSSWIPDPGLARMYCDNYDGYLEDEGEFHSIAFDLQETSDKTYLVGIMDTIEVTKEKQLRIILTLEGEISLVGSASSPTGGIPKYRISINLYLGES